MLNLKKLGQIVMYMVVSSIDECVIYGPFGTCAEALEFAERVDGSVFECHARLTSTNEI
jgi:hypothetical protein